jgi:hypothetical protein
MTPFLRPVEATFFAYLLAAGAAAQQPQTAQEAAAGPQVAIIGCIDRAAPAAADDPARTTPPPAGQAAQPPARAYKLIDAQPGGGSPVVDPSGRVVSTPPAKAPDVVEPQYWLTGPPTIDFAKYQNQRVEIIGTLKAASTTATTVQTTPSPDAPKTVLTAASVRVVSTECK